jgi:cytochrome c551/c552
MLIALWWSGAWGAPAPRAILVVPPPSNATLQKTIEKALATSGARVRRFEVIEKRLQGAKSPDPPAVDKVSVAFKKARQHYLGQEFSEMSLVLLEAERDSLPVLVAQPQRAAALNRMLGVALMSGNDTTQKTGAIERFRLALSLAPKQMLDPAHYPPATSAAFRKVRDELATIPRHRLQIKAPRGAQIVLDGKLHPFDKRRFSVTAGVHYLQVRALGYASKQSSIDVRGPRTMTIPLIANKSKEKTEAQLAALLRDGQLDPRNPLHATKLLELASAEQLVSWKLATGKIALGLGDRQGKLLRHMATPPDKIHDLWPRLQRGDAKPPTPIYKRWWFWTGIVVVATAIAVPTAIVVSQPSTIEVVPRAVP